MAKTSMVERDVKRAKLVAKYAEKRAALKKIVLNPESSYEEKMEAQAKLQKLPRDSSPVRMRNRCALTGRPRGVYRKFGLGRNKLREATMSGNVPGLRKASWERNNTRHSSFNTAILAGLPGRFTASGHYNRRFRSTDIGATSKVLTYEHD
jgi:small subunit ribosomal protein S14